MLICDPCIKVVLTAQATGLTAGNYKANLVGLLDILLIYKTLKGQTILINIIMSE